MKIIILAIVAILLIVWVVAIIYKEFQELLRKTFQKKGNTQCRMEFSDNILTKEQQDEVENHFNNKL